MVDAFVISYGLILLAELGDKSQLLTLAFATRYRAWLVLAGVSIAALVMLGVSVALGTLFAMAMPTQAIQVAAGVAFLIFAAWVLRGEGHDHAEGARPERTATSAFATVVVAFLVAEFGDKTMLATVTLAATQDPIGTWLGASAGMVSANVAAIIVGALLGSRLPQRPIQVLAALAFVIVGAVLIAEGFGLL